MICYSGRIAIYSFLFVVTSFTIIFLPSRIFSALSQVPGCVIFGPIVYFLCINIILKLIYNGEPYQIAVRAALLGFIFSLGIFIKIHSESGLQVFGVYMCVMAIFHYTEFLSIAIIQPNLVSTDSFVINHSKEYTIAALTSWTEYFLEYYFFSSMKTIHWLSNIGLIICVGGELLRKSAMFTAKSNFNHIVQCHKNPDHVLVTHGVYGLCRHPSYVGWFYWSVGTQIILLNPLCTLAYAYVSWIFFRDRINIEELTLLNFFGEEYYNYQKKVGSGLPLIEGYKLEA
ncbi:Isoprenylcysteine carboxyl methyltransferase (ICMT) family [Popillia japonica]|uniref:Protein-S-isoprenylcysteine O-methyltransferase n=1 Tax=Popillia japonica TaxID=7064 RepID=A0AAW1LUC6_POPJA